MAAQVRSISQLALDEQVVDNAPLEQALETRQEAKDEAGAARRAYSEADEVAKGEIEKLELPDGMVVRVGRFRLERKFREGRSVSFETQPASRVRISLLGDDE